MNIAGKPGMTADWLVQTLLSSLSIHRAILMYQCAFVFSDIYFSFPAQRYRTEIRVDPPVLNLSWVGQLYKPTEHTSASTLWRVLHRPLGWERGCF